MPASEYCVQCALVPLDLVHLRNVLAVLIVPRIHHLRGIAALRLQDGREEVALIVIVLRVRLDGEVDLCVA